MKKVRKVINFGVSKFKYYLLSVLNYFIPKSKYKVYIYDKRFRKDNSWAIMSYLKRNSQYKKYLVYYHTDTKLESSNNIIFVSSSLLSMWYRLRSKTVIYSYDDLIKIKPTKTQFVLNTMHGSPLKNIGYLAGDSKFKKLWRFEKDFTHILCTSNYFKEVIKKAFGASEEQCLVLGYPRNDFLFYANEKMNRLGIDVGAYKNIIMWMPTWRGLISSGTNRESTTDFPIIDILNIDKLNDYLQNNNNLLIIKPHPIQISLDIFDKKLSNIKIITDFDLNSRDIFLYELFNEVDALLTDYSSVYFDFLLTQKPIGFTIDDFDSYEDKRGFVVNNPLEIMPGSKIRTFMELITFLKDLNNECDNYSEERKNINNLVNKYHDKNSTQRILERFGIGN